MKKELVDDIKVKMDSAIEAFDGMAGKFPQGKFNDTDRQKVGRKAIQIEDRWNEISQVWAKIKNREDPIIKNLDTAIQAAEICA